jgi:hypothetical protein
VEPLGRSCCSDPDVAAIQDGKALGGQIMVKECKSAVLGGVAGRRLRPGLRLLYRLLEAIVPASQAVYGYTWVILFGALCMGMTGVTFMARVPEIMMPPTAQQSSIGERFLAPLRDSNFRNLAQFLLFWGFASNLAIPFFTVFMLKDLKWNLLLLHQEYYPLFRRWPGQGKA